MDKKALRDVDFMRIARALALRAKGRTSPNPLVGAVIVKDGKIIARGFHALCGGDHAEVVALKKAGKKAKGAKLYVTLEPCGHAGRTPPCAERIIKSGIKEVIVGVKDPNPVNNGQSLIQLRRAGIKVKVGFLKDELTGMNEWFNKYITKKMPFVVVKCAQTIDGKIATAAGRSKWITAKQTRDYAHKLRSDFDAILVGINTVLKDNPRLNARSKRKRIKKIIVDSRLRLPLAAKLFRYTDPSDIFIATTAKAPKKKINVLLNKGVHVVVCPSTKEGVDLRYLLRQLGRNEIANLLIEGGARIIGSALKAGLADKMIIFLSPKIMGDQHAKSSVAGLKIRDVNRLVSLKKPTIRKLGSTNDDMIIEGYV